ncbi:DTW domain-containing protein [Striga hermonthica]|uniref:tRNA-uridine aminocarboxypropyltransferase n=1 Tax=Striga hermonthica TaxID=68872 RepID=A0A9N7R332_STRHE|nr:DTW domain-containing protein [Striga hermonthica]
MIPAKPLFSSKTPFLFPSHHNFWNFFVKDPQSSMGTKPISTKYSSSTPKYAQEIADAEGSISLQEWQGWGPISPVPSTVNQVIHDLKLLENEVGACMTFDGNHGKLSGGFKVHEDKKHRAKYASLGTSEEKIQFFSARQIACRLLGSRGYLCQKCWLALEDCMCSKVTKCSLWHRVHIWLYMHPKDFLRQNNTGKLLWQVFGVKAASLCLFGITEDEEIMWNELSRAGRNMVWCLYPSKNAFTESVKDGVGCSMNLESQGVLANEDNTMHFILIDGTWSNSSAMFRRLQDRAELEWNKELRCITLNMGVSLMHKLRPQPSWDRTCTAAAAAGLLYELQLIRELSNFGLEVSANSVEHALEVLLQALTTRRLRMGSFCWLQV